MHDKSLIDKVLRNPIVAEVIEATHELGLPNCFVVAGCVAQTVWNLAHARDPAADIKDIDIVYFDPDPSESTEWANQERVRRRFKAVPIALDIKNQARVHLWYPQAFGYAVPPYASVEQAITTFPTTATAIGIRKEQTGYRIFAPFGVHDLLGLVVRPNKRQITREIYEAKTKRWSAIWPQLIVIPWNDPERAHATTYL